MLSTLAILVIGMCVMLVQAHEHRNVTVPAGLSCTDVDIPPFQSYHIHVLFWTNNDQSILMAENLLKAFMEKFSLTAEKNMCQYNPGDLEETELCVFETDYAAAGPFLTAQTAVFVPVNLFEETVAWMIKYKGKLDMFAHPNSGCGLMDHVSHGLWAGNKWEVDGSIFV
jgi:aromatic ring-cleaving dioxygenase